MTFGCFALAWVVTFALSNAEWLRKIQGESFLLLWPLFSVLVMIVVIIIVSKYRLKIGKQCETEIRNAAISHVDMPHLLMNAGPLDALYVKGYYLLRLYLLGILTYKEGVLSVDEERLKSLMDRGGRHSKIAYVILREVRKTGTRSIEQVLVRIHGYDSYDDHALAKRISEARQKSSRLTSWLLAAAFGLIWGVGCAKLTLGIMHGKSIELLAILFVVGIVLSIVACVKVSRANKQKLDDAVYQAIMRNIRQRPQECDYAIIPQLNDKLSEETTRHKVLNWYFQNPTKMQYEAILHTPEDTFLHDWGVACIRQYEEIRRAQQAEAARKAAASDASGCSGCSSCSSCSSCGGCGGCGGCGD